eukprot:2961748-Rhodomonas_salina.4
MASRYAHGSTDPIALRVAHVKRQVCAVSQYWKHHARFQYHKRVPYCAMVLGAPSGLHGSSRSTCVGR